MAKENQSCVDQVELVQYKHVLYATQILNYVIVTFSQNCLTNRPKDYQNFLAAQGSLKVSQVSLS